MIITTEPVKQNKKSEGTEASREEIDLSNNSIKVILLFIIYLLYDNHLINFAGLHYILTNSFLALVLLLLYFELYKKDPKSIKNLILPILAVALVSITYKFHYLAIEKYKNYSDILGIHEDACTNGDNLACHKIAKAALRAGSVHSAFPYFSKACAFENKHACAWIRSNEIP
jgi:hypothetical protein